MTIRKSLPGALFLAAFVVLTASPVAATPILPAHSSWQYTFTDPTAILNWSTTGVWGNSNIGDAPFGNHTGPYVATDPLLPSDPTGFFIYSTYWKADEPTPEPGPDDLWVRSTFDLTGYDLGSALWYLGVDNGFKLYINGTLIANDNKEGFTSKWEYSGNFGGVKLNDGLNYVAVALEDHGYLTAFDMEVTADAKPVPEPASSLMLLTGGLMALGGLRRRWR